MDLTIRVIDAAISTITIIIAVNVEILAGKIKYLALPKISVAAQINVSTCG